MSTPNDNKRKQLIGKLKELFQLAPAPAGQLVQLQRNGLGVNCRHAGGQHEALVTLAGAAAAPAAQ